MSPPEPDFAMDELVAALEAKQGQQGEGWRVVELAAATGHSPEWIRSRLNALKEQGLVEVIRGGRTITALDGRIMHITSYRLRGRRETRDG